MTPPEAFSQEQSRAMWKNTVTHFGNQGNWDIIAQFDPTLKEVRQEIHDQNAAIYKRDGIFAPDTSQKITAISERIVRLTVLAGYIVINGKNLQHGQDIALIQNVMGTVEDIHVKRKDRYNIRLTTDDALIAMFHGILQNRQDLKGKLPWDAIVPLAADTIDLGDLPRVDKEIKRLELLVNAPADLVTDALDVSCENETNIIQRLNRLPLLHPNVRIPPEVDSNITLLISRIPEGNREMIRDAYIWFIRMNHKYILELTDDHMIERLKQLGSVVYKLWDTLDFDVKHRFINDDIMHELNELYNEVGPRGVTVLDSIEKVFSVLSGPEFGFNGEELAIRLIEIVRANPTARFPAFEKFFTMDNEMVEAARPISGKIKLGLNDLFRQQ